MVHGFNTYKQKFENEEDSAENLFLASTVPLRLESSGDSSSTPIEIWQNTRACSPKHCLPLMIEYAKETKDKI